MYNPNGTLVESTPARAFSFGVNGAKVGGAPVPPAPTSVPVLVGPGELVVGAAVGLFVGTTVEPLTLMILLSPPAGVLSRTASTARLARPLGAPLRNWIE